MKRKQIDFSNQHRILDFILKMEDIQDKYVLEDSEGYLRVNAHSVNGVLYAARDFDEIFLVNITRPKTYPDFIKEFEV